MFYESKTRFPVNRALFDQMLVFLFVSSPCETVKCPDVSDERIACIFTATCFKWILRWWPATRQQILTSLLTHIAHSASVVTYPSTKHAQSTSAAAPGHATVTIIFQYCLHISQWRSPGNCLFLEILTPTGSEKSYTLFRSSIAMTGQTPSNRPIQQSLSDPENSGASYRPVFPI